MNNTFRILLCISLLQITSIAFAGETAKKPGDPTWLLPVPEIHPDPKIPTLKQIVGHTWGQDISNHAEIERYITALAKAAPDRTKLIKYGTSNQGKSLFYLVISSPRNMIQLETIRRDNLALADSRQINPKQAAEITADQPALVWLAYCVHGDETSPSDAALLTAYHLLADRRKSTKELLEKVVVIIDPLQNPDGRDRFVSFHRESRGVFLQSNPFASDRLQRWPGGRSNHYYFDMNRDWFLQTQKETKSRVAAFLKWKPQIFVDAHEMRANSTFFFDPPKEPFNPHVLPRQKDWYMKIGKHHAGRFDQYGFAYTNREIFDAFGPQYGSTWPTLHGAIGILWEQAGVRGRVVLRKDQTKLHYHDGVRHHYISGIATIEAAAKHRKQLLQDFYKSAADSVNLGRKGSIRDFYLLEGKRPARAAALARLLIQNGIEVQRVSRSVKLKAIDILVQKSQTHEIPKGSYRISLAQPASRLALTLLERHQDMGKKFLDRQIERVKRRKSDEIYDVTAWSLPLEFGVQCLAGSSQVDVFSAPIQNPRAAGKVIGNEAKVAYMMPGSDDSAAKSLCSWLRQGMRVRVMGEPTKVGGVSFPRGSLLLRVSENPKTLHDAVRHAAGEQGITIQALNTAFVEKGAGLGGPHAHWVKPPRVLLMVDRPAQYSVGHTWYLFDQAWRYPVSRVAGRYLAKVDLEKFDTLILPHGSYKGDDAPKEDAVRRIKAWVQDGGTLILVRGAAAWAAGEKVNLLAAKPVRRKIMDADGKVVKSKDKDGKEKDATEPPLKVPGAFLRAKVNTEHFVTYGFEAELPVHFDSDLLFTPLKPTGGKNLVTFVAKNRLLASGFCWEQTLDMLPGKPYVVHQPMGQGHVIAFADDPNYRAMSPVLQRLFFNAVFFGPGH